MADVAGNEDAGRMERRAAASASRRDVENAVYDFGCDLVAAASGIARCAAERDAARAVPSLLGCVEAALQELSVACAALERANAWTSRQETDPRRGTAMARLDRGYKNLAVALGDAQGASRAARSLAARMVERASGHDR